MYKCILLSALFLTAGFQAAFAQVVLQETFGSGANAFKMDFVTIGNPGNAPDTTGSPNPAGSVAYTYSIGKYEVSREMINKANALAGLNVPLYDMESPLQWGNGNNPNKPATGMNWNQAAVFVNWLNTSKGYAAAYKFDSNSYVTRWLNTDAGFSASNPYRNSGSFFFLPSVDEWYKAAYYNPTTGAYTKYPNGSNVAPVPVTDGLTGAVYTTGGSVWDGGGGPADINNAGALSAYGTMAQAGNVAEFQEISDFKGDSQSQANDIPVRGGSFYGHIWQPTGSLDIFFASDFRNDNVPATVSTFDLGFRVASAAIPEPSSLSLLALGGVVVALGRRRR